MTKINVRAVNITTGENRRIRVFHPHLWTSHPEQKVLMYAQALYIRKVLALNLNA